MCLVWWSNSWTVCELFYWSAKEQETQRKAVTLLVLKTFVTQAVYDTCFVIIVTATDLYDTRAPSTCSGKKKKKNHIYANRDVKQLNKDVSKGNKIQLGIANNIYNFHRCNPENNVNKKDAAKWPFLKSISRSTKYLHINLLIADEAPQC